MILRAMVQIEFDGIYNLQSATESLLDLPVGSCIKGEIKVVR